jgi:hypothetical protein
MSKTNYIIYKNKFIFIDTFNEQIDEYLEIISKYNYLIFSNYNYTDFAAKSNNKFKFEYANLQFNHGNIFNTSIFNKKINFLPENITHIRLAYKFNNYICLPKNLLLLEFGSEFNKYISLDNCNKLTHLIFGTCFNIHIDLYPKSLTHLIFGYFFNKPITNLPSSLKYLKFGDKFNQSIKLPPNLTHLILGEDFNGLLDFPEKLECLKVYFNNFNLTYIQNISKLNYLTDLKLIGNKSSDLKILLPGNLKKLSYYNNGNLPNILPSNLTHLTLGYCFTQSLSLNHNIKYVKLCGNDSFSILENLPNSIEILHLDQYFSNQLTNLPNSIKKIIFNLNCTYPNELNNLPNSIEFIKLPRNYNLQIKNIPKNLKTIICSKKYLFVNDFISKYKVIIYD